MISDADYSTDVYNRRLNDAVEYQDFVCRALHRRGIVLQNLGSKKQQLRGENLFGMEIKNDKRLAGDDGQPATGNIYIETAESTTPRRPLVPSGILREDNSWLFAIGNRHELFIFCKKQLRRLHDFLLGGKRIDGMKLKDGNSTNTSRGFVMTRQKAIQYCCRHIEFDEKDRS